MYYHEVEWNQNLWLETTATRLEGRERFTRKEKNCFHIDANEMDDWVVQQIHSLLGLPPRFLAYDIQKVANINKERWKTCQKLKDESNKKNE